MFTRRLPLAIATVLLAVGCTAVGIALPAAAAEMPIHAAPTFTVTGGQINDIGGLTPGDSTPPAFLTLNAIGTVTYRLRAETAGSGPLARALQVRIVAVSDGATLYAGSLDGASFGAPGDQTGPRTLPDGSETLAVTASLPESAANDVQGATLTVSWIVDASGAEGNQR
jgi:hypothetical protein